MEKTHNLEVVGSSPTWSTLKIRELRRFRDSLFLFGEIQAKFATEKLGYEMPCNLFERNDIAWYCRIFGNNAYLIITV